MQFYSMKDPALKGPIKKIIVKVKIQKPDHFDTLSKALFSVPIQLF